MSVEIWLMIAMLFGFICGTAFGYELHRIRKSKDE